MANRGFKDEITVTNVDQSTASKGQLSDTSVGTGLSGFGDLLDQTITGVDEGIQELITDEVQDQVDLLDKDLGVDTLADINADPEVVGVPPALEKGSENLAGVQTAFNQGRISEDVYFARLHSMVKQLRARYPGYRDQIDTIVSEE